MTISRFAPRWIPLTFVLLLLAGACPAFAADVLPWTRDDAAHLLRRAGFGGTPAQIDSLHALGRDAAVEYLLSGTVPAGAQPVFAPVTFAEFKTTPVDKADKPDADLKQLAQMIQRQGRADLALYRADWINRMLRTDRPLEEKMSLFWHGLLCSGVQEVKLGTLMIQQNKLYHENALGNYKHLVGALIHDPAMLKYLDNDKNVVGKPNENLGRELMELFTMGEGQGYTEKDIAEVARALTGMGVLPREVKAQFRPGQHDARPKTIFGKTGNYRPDDVVELIFERPQPAQYLAKKLWEFFVYPNPSQADIAPVADALTQSKFELKPALRVIFSSPAFYESKAKFALIQSPTELAISTARELEQNVDGAPIAAQLGKMGQELFQPPNVKGWPGGEQWITAATLYNRYNACSALVEGKLIGGNGPMIIKPNNANAQARELRLERAAANGRPGIARMTPVSPAKLFPTLPAQPTAVQIVDAAIDRFLQRPLNPDKRAALVGIFGNDPIKIGQFSSDQRIREMISLLLSTPEYQVH
jgi:uncharacterized protein (DUF1800 family)